MINPEIDNIVGWGGGITLLTYVANLLWRQFGKTRVEGARDRAEIDILESLREENKLLRERVRLVEAERDSAKEEVTMLRDQVQTLKRDIGALDMRVNELLAKLKR